MTDAISYEQLKAKLGPAPDQTQQRLYFAALLAQAAAVPADDFIVVGGSAIEFYTVGEYTSGDIDIVSSQADRLRAVLRSWRFERDGRIWVNDELGLVVDLNTYPYTGAFDKTTVVTTPYGSIRIAAIEDLIVKRLASAKHWKQRGDFDHAKLLAAGFQDRVDWAYVERLASEADVSDYLTRLREVISSSEPPRGPSRANRRP